MVTIRNIIIITLSVIISLIFILFVIPQIHLVLIFFGVELWIQYLTLFIIIPCYFTLVLWLVLSEIKTQFKSQDKISRLKEVDDVETQTKQKEGAKDLDVKIRLIYDSIKKILNESEKFSIKELSEMLDINYTETYQIIINLISEQMVSGSIEGEDFIKKS